jgi:hypothetical protein
MFVGWGEQGQGTGDKQPGYLDQVIQETPDCEGHYYYRIYKVNKYII